MTTRRDFLKTGAAASGALIATGIPGLARAAERAIQTPPSPMNILVLGGTGFIGPHLVRHAIARGHKVTIFTRGRRGGELPDAVERLVGDRMINDTIPQGNLKALEGRTWDVVFDDSATDPRWVRQSTTLLKDSGMYMFVSSTGVFLPYLTPNNDESAPVIVDPPDSRDYGIQKAQSERVVMTAFGDRGCVVRPGYIVGPGDTTFRFPYWPQRLAKGGETLAPGPSDPTQFIDVRDLVEFMVRLVEYKLGGIYNVTGPRDRTTFREFLTEAHTAMRSQSQLIWIDDREFLREQRLSYGIPWIKAEGNNLHHMQIKNAKAVALGLMFRPVTVTVRDTWGWWQGEPSERRAIANAGGRNGFWILPEREQEVIAEWKKRT